MMNMCQAYLLSFWEGAQMDWIYGRRLYYRIALPRAIIPFFFLLISQSFDHINTFIGMITFVFRYHPSEL